MHTSALTFTFWKLPRYLTVLLTGPTTLGLFAAVVVAIAVPEARSPREMLFAFGTGAVMSLGIFAPIAGALAFRVPLRRWLTMHGRAVRWYGSILTAFALGYTVASLRHQPADAYIGPVFLAFVLFALAKIIFAIVFAPTNGPSSGSSGGSSPPEAPVPRPPGGRPPALSAAAVVER
jgi:hypothetical protein